eukprot:6580867-Prymnesium_polylepis.1
MAPPLLGEGGGGTAPRGAQPHHRSVRGWPLPAALARPDTWRPRRAEPHKIDAPAPRSEYATGGTQHTSSFEVTDPRLLEVRKIHAATLIQSAPNRESSRTRTHARAGARAPRSARARSRNARSD